MHARLLLLLATVLLFGCPPTVDRGDDDDSGPAGDDDDDAGAVLVDWQTTDGDFTFEVLVDEAPITASNFLAYVDSGFFDGDDGLGATILHRIIAGFVVQGGGRTEADWKETMPAIVNEASDSGLSNERGTVAMARTDAPDSATSQWFVNLDDNLFLDPGGSTPDGYAVFAIVTEGMDVMDDISTVSTDGGDAPLTPITVLDVSRR